jgi:secretion/DNA translocation related CpaE-like protein
MINNPFGFPQRGAGHTGIHRCSDTLHFSPRAGQSDGMTDRSGSRSCAVVVTADEELLDQVLAVAAAVDVELEVLPDAGAVRSRWAGAAAVLIGVDQASAVAAMMLPRRAEAYVVGPDHARDLLHAWSVPLGAAVASLPSGVGWLTGAVADAVGSRIGGGRLLAVVGASGGAGASTCAAGLVVTAALRAQRCLLVDADPLGGGIDLLLGAERAPGWRWPRLIAARGHLGDLAGQVPRVDGVDVLSMARTESSDPGPDAMKAVLISATRSHDLVVVDLPRTLGPAGREVLRRADALVLTAVADLRSIAAGTRLLEQLGDVSGTTGLVVRVPRRRTVGPETVAEGLGLPLLAWVAEDPSLRAGAERGDPPARMSRSALGRACRAVLDWPELNARPAA